MTRPASLARAPLGQVRWVFADVDGTLTVDGRLTSAVLGALERLGRWNIPVILVSGRPAGWAHAWIHQWPVSAVIAENGGLTFWWEHSRRSRVKKPARGAAAGSPVLRQAFAEPERTRLATRAALRAHVEAVLPLVPGAALSSDSRYTEVDLAIDHGEAVHLEPGSVDVLEAALRARGVRAVRSSVHLNCWLGRFDKRTAVEAHARRVLGVGVDRLRRHAVYVGDSFNDEPLFEAFPLSVGVANVREVLDRLASPPAYITRSPGGRGFAELVLAIGRARRAR